MQSRLLRVPCAPPRTLPRASFRALPWALLGALLCAVFGGLLWAPPQALAAPGRALPAVASANAAPVQTVPAQDPPAGPLTPQTGDLGRRVTAALAALPAGGGTVRIPAGESSFSTTIRLTRAGQQIACDPGAVLRYTGSGDAILIALAAGANQEIDIAGGCQIEGTAAAQNGIHITPGNTITLRGLRISGFSRGNAIQLSGANTVQIKDCSLNGNGHGVDMTTVPGYAPNAVHVSGNNISGNDWGVYIWNAHVVASRALANEYRDNVLEGNRRGDMFLGWDAHTLVEGNYFESGGVAIAIGTSGDRVFDMHISRNYFTISPAYRSEIEIGDASGVFVEENYEEGIAGAATGCSVNVVPGIRGGANNVFLRNAFSRVSESKMSAREFCYEGSAKIPPGVLGTWRLAGGVSIEGPVEAEGARLAGPVEFSQGAVASTAAPIEPGQACTQEGALLIAHAAGRPAQLFFCSGLRWVQVTRPAAQSTSK